MKGILTAAALLSTIGLVTTANALETTNENTASHEVVTFKENTRVVQEIAGHPAVKFKPL